MWVIPTNIYQTTNILLIYFKMLIIDQLSVNTTFLWKIITFPKQKKM